MPVKFYHSVIHVLGFFIYILYLFRLDIFCTFSHFSDVIGFLQTTDNPMTQIPVVVLVIAIVINVVAFIVIVIVRDVVIDMIVIVFVIVTVVVVKICLFSLLVIFSLMAGVYP